MDRSTRPMDDAKGPPRPGSGRPALAGPPQLLTGGMVAYNEEANIGPALRSLLEQELPDGVAWDAIWVVASGCTDGTVGVVRAIAETDGRVRLVKEPERGGKAKALDLILQRAQGVDLVLLNSDARATPGAILALWEASRTLVSPYAVMGQPIVVNPTKDPVARIVGLLWTLHHEFHLASLGPGGGNHLSDELLLLSRPGIPALPDGVINDGAYIGAWLDRYGGHRLYAPDARVAIQVPRTLGDYLTQRRRILVGHAQVSEVLGRRPSTLPQLALADPRAALRVLWRAIQRDPRRLFDLFLLTVPELAAAVLAAWDRLPPQRSHTRWQRIRHPSSW
jgi:glycosyltransferase involved in cell wall biosynthesis